MRRVVKITYLPNEREYGIFVQGKEWHYTGLSFGDQESAEKMRDAIQRIWIRPHDRGKDTLWKRRDLPGRRGRVG